VVLNITQINVTIGISTRALVKGRNSKNDQGVAMQVISVSN